MSPPTPGTSPTPASPPHEPADPAGHPAPDHPATPPGHTHTAHDTDQALGELARALHDLGVTARVITPGTRPPFVRASHPGAPALAENITCQHGPDQTPWFHWSWNDPITPARHARAAATSIRRVLTPQADQ